MSFNKGFTPFGVETQNIRLFNTGKNFPQRIRFTLDQSDCQAKFSGIKLVRLSKYQI
jgi:hypothetical protein